MSNQVIEVANIKLAIGVTEQKLLEASDAFELAFLKGKPGYISRDLTRLADGSYADIVRWANEEAAMAVMQEASRSSACQAFFSLMALASDNPEDGVSHYSVLSSYSSGD